jgi:hypothetical protein|tara:strand:+ start:160 stop:444 length:285 start_codon:yes stop_codon:yes gene_type:complete
MDAISGSERNALVQAYVKHEPSPRVLSSNPSDASTVTNLTDLTELAQRAELSGDDIRTDVIKRAQALLSDPNWPSDNDLEGLSEKLLSTDDFIG